MRIFDSMLYNVAQGRSIVGVSGATNPFLSCIFCFMNIERRWVASENIYFCMTCVVWKSLS